MSMRELSPRVSVTRRAGARALVSRWGPGPGVMSVATIVAPALRATSTGETRALPVVPCRPALTQQRQH